MVDTVLFDLWNTLIYCPTKDRLTEVIKLLGLEGKVDYKRLIEDAEKTMFLDAKFNDRKFFKWVCEKYMVSCDGKKLDAAVRIWKSRLDGAKLFPESVEVIERLGKVYKLGLVSNIEASGVEYMRRRHDMLLKHFDVVIMSCNVGLAKPDERIFKLAMEKLKSKPDETVMVGDYPRVDIESALNAGLHAVLIDRGGVHACRHMKVKSLNDLDEVIKRIK